MGANEPLPAALVSFVCGFHESGTHCAERKQGDKREYEERERTSEGHIGFFLNTAGNSPQFRP
jgi:hypothetical protein